MRGYTALTAHEREQGLQVLHDQAENIKAGIQSGEMDWDEAVITLMSGVGFAVHGTMTTEIDVAMRVAMEIVVTWFETDVPCMLLANQKKGPR
jgi:hypothetical protein